MITELKPYSDYKPSGIEWLDDVPTHWDVRRLKNSATLIMGQSPSSEDCSKNPIGLPFLQGCAEFGDNIPDPIQYCHSPAKISPQGALLLSIRAPVGRINLADQRYGIGRGLVAVVPKPDLALAFGKFLLKVSSFGLSTVATGSTYDAVSVGDVGSLPAAFPPLPEQTAIARFLDHTTSQIDRYIRTKQKLIALLEEQKQTIIHQAVTGQIDVRTGQPYLDYKPSGVKWLKSVPKHWQVVRNGRLFIQRNEIGYPDLPILEVSLRHGVRVRNFEDPSRKQIMSDRSMYKRTIKGDIAYNMMRMWQGAVGVVPADGLVSPAYVVAKPLPETDSRYFESLFRTEEYMTEVDKMSRGIVKDRNRLYWEDFKQMLSPRPPQREQILITEAIERNIEYINLGVRNIRRQIHLVEEYRTRLIADVVTGKLDVREAAAELPQMDPKTHEDGVNSFLSEQDSLTTRSDNEQEARP